MNITITKDQNPKHPRTFWIDAMEEPDIIYRSNFQGKEITDPNNSKRIWNGEGKRNFCFVIPEEYVEDLLARKWPIKKARSNDETNNTYYAAAKVIFRTNERTGMVEPEMHKFYGLEDRNPIDITELNAADLDKQDIIGARFAVNESRDVYVASNGTEAVTLYLNYGEFYVQESNKFKARWSKDLIEETDDE